jgi:hypothetical protein
MKNNRGRERKTKKRERVSESNHVKYLHVLPQGTGMSVRFITARYPTVVGLV